MDLIPVMIVEDERIILQDLLTLVDWEKSGFRVVATASNGKQGLNKFDEVHPQLVVTDIRMPVLNGLEMMREILNGSPDTVFLILSAYEEFSYAKEALTLGADDYILKTEISSELLYQKLISISEKLRRRGITAQYNSLIQLSRVISNSIVLEKIPEEAEEALCETLNKCFYDGIPFPVIKAEAVSTVQACYDSLQISDRFQTPAPSTQDGLKNWLREQFKSLSALNKGIYFQRYSPIIINAIEYIRQHFNNPKLKIDNIADHIGLSYSRLSVLFKLEIGQTINDYITAVRIDEAKKLLFSGKYKVYEVSEMVGYKTSQYFSQVFYQYTGQYPNKYHRGAES